jgi:hypothetical protein
MIRAGSVEAHRNAATLAALFRPTAAEWLAQLVAGADYLTALADRMARTRDPSIADEIGAQLEGIRRANARAFAELTTEGGANDRS